MAITVRAAAEDWPAVRGLLTDAKLPLDGAADAFATGVVIRDGVRVVGCAAIECHDDAALLRSVAVAPDRRGRGLGESLVHAAEATARAAGASDIILLTETAEPWFERLGYAAMERSAVPPRVADSIEFRTACSETAVVMTRRL